MFPPEPVDRGVNLLNTEAMVTAIEDCKDISLEDDRLWLDWSTLVELIGTADSDNTLATGGMNGFDREKTAWDSNKEFRNWTKLVTCRDVTTSCFSSTVKRINELKVVGGIAFLSQTCRVNTGGVIGELVDFMFWNLDRGEYNIALYQYVKKKKKKSLSWNAQAIKLILEK